MIDIDLKFQIALFGAMEDISPKPDTLKYFIDAFADKELIPTTFQEIGLLGVVERVSFKSSDNIWNVELGSNRIDIHKSNQDFKITNMGDLKQFISDAKEILLKINDKFPKKYNRIALITRHIVKEMIPEEMAKVFNKVSNPIELYRNHNPSEWSNRAVSRIPINLKVEEVVNVISEINRIQGNLKINSKVEPIDRIEIKFDINTYQVNAEFRFELEHINLFLDEATKLETQLLSDYVKLIS